MTPLLAAALIVKDEAHCIERTLGSLRDAVDDVYVVDTGSTDGTPEVIQKWRAKWPTIGLHTSDKTFVDYATARNDALDLVRRGALDLVRCGDPAGWTLSLSADEVLHGGAALRAYLATLSADTAYDAVLVEVRTPSGSFDYPRVLRTGGPWRYVGAIHEEPRHRDDPARVPQHRASGCWIEYAPTDPQRLARRLRERDLPLLERSLAQAEPKSEARKRLLVLLAQTHEHLAAGGGDHAGGGGGAGVEGSAAGANAAKTLALYSALGWYVVAAVQEDVFHAKWKALNVAEQLGIYAPKEMVHRLKKVAAEDPREPAVAFMLAAAHANAGDLREALDATRRAAKVAKDAVRDPEHPHDPHGLLWRPWHLAALCARALGHKPAVQRYAELGLAAGGPPEMFEEFAASALHT